MIRVGEARQSVKNRTHLCSDTCYNHAIALLQKRYGDPSKVLATHQKEIKQWVVIKSDNAKGFREFQIS